MEAIIDEDVDITQDIRGLNINIQDVNIDRLSKEKDRYKAIMVVLAMSGGIMTQALGTRYPQVNWLTGESIPLAARIINHLDDEMEEMCKRFTVMQERKRVERMNEPQSLDGRDQEEIAKWMTKLGQTVGFHALNRGITASMGENSSVLDLSNMIQKLLLGDTNNFMGMMKKIQAIFG